MATSAGATRPADQITFAHNSERQFARLLDFYRVEWEYEPTAFPIEWDGAGQPTQHFRPDFFLPGFGLYIEITTLNQRLVTKKNRKIRRLRELYPDVRIKILYQRDYLSLLAKYGLEPRARWPRTRPRSSEIPCSPRSREPPPREPGRPGKRRRTRLRTSFAGRSGQHGRGWGGLGRSAWLDGLRLGRSASGRGNEPVGRLSGRRRRGAPGWCPTRRGRSRRCRPTPSWCGWPRCHSRPRSPSAGVPPSPSEPDSRTPPPVTGPISSCSVSATCPRCGWADPSLLAWGVAGVPRAVVQSPRPGWAAGLGARWIHREVSK